MLADARRPSDNHAPSTSLPKQHLHHALGIRKVQRGGIRALLQALRPVNGERMVPTLEAKYEWHGALRLIYKITIIVIEDYRWCESSV
jgi:hypothetical protein